jgi:hypothetical protein
MPHSVATPSGALIKEVRFAVDSPLEGDRCEPSVPTRGTALFETAGFSMQPRMWGLRSAMLDASIKRSSLQLAGTVCQLVLHCVT